MYKNKFFATFHTDLLNLCDSWKYFSYVELVEVMRQQGDSIFVDLLNNVRVEAILKTDIVSIILR